MSTSARMLSLLSLLQTHRYWPGDDLAQRLEVSGRTLRRDIERLRDLGYVVDATRGVAGGYQLRAGGQLPPLLLEDDEAVAIAAGLRTAAAGSVGGLEETSVQALTKVVALMPPRLRRRMDALTSQTDAPGPWASGPTVDAAILTALAQACRDDEPLEFDYQARDADPSHRRVEPHRLVSLGRRWYLVAYDRDRQDWRSFRVDRLTAPVTGGARFRPRDLPGGDALAFVQAGFRRIPQRYAVRVRLASPAPPVAWAAGRWGDVSETGPEECLLEMAVDSLSWPLMVLAQVGVPFEVESPPELREECARVAALFSTAATVGPHGPAVADGGGHGGRDRSGS